MKAKSLKLPRSKQCLGWRSPQLKGDPGGLTGTVSAVSTVLTAGTGAVLAVLWGFPSGQKPGVFILPAAESWSHKFRAGKASPKLSGSFSAITVFEPCAVGDNHLFGDQRVC